MGFFAAFPRKLFFTWFLVNLQVNHGFPFFFSILGFQMVFLMLTHYGKGAIDQLYLKGMSPKGAVISRVSVNTLTLLHCEWVNKRHATVALKMSSGDCHRGISDHYR